MNSISFSLFGDRPKYCVGLIKNVRLAQAFFPDFVVRVYYDQTVPGQVIRELELLGCQLVDMTRHPLAKAKAFWRFLVIDEPEIEYFLIRDADGRLSRRDRQLFERWRDAGEGQFYVALDHHWFHKTMMAGLWGGRAMALDMARRIQDYPSVVRYGDDEDFLEACIYPLIASELVRYTYDTQELPRADLDYIGMTYTDKDLPRLSFQLELLEALIRARLVTRGQVADFAGGLLRQLPVGAPLLNLSGWLARELVGYVRCKYRWGLRPWLQGKLGHGNKALL